MGSLNKVLLIGNLGKDPELRFTPDGLAILKFPIATTEYFNDKSGSRTERTTWHNIVIFGKMGQNLANYLNKGKQVFVEGRISTFSYDDKDGVKKYRTEIVANNIVFLGAKGAGGPAEGAPAYSEAEAGGAGFPETSGSSSNFSAGSPSGEDDDIPF